MNLDNVEITIFHWKDYGSKGSSSAIEAFKQWDPTVALAGRPKLFVAFNFSHRLLRYRGCTLKQANDLAIRYQNEISPDGRIITVTI